MEGDWEGFLVLSCLLRNTACLRGVFGCTLIFLAMSCMLSKDLLGMVQNETEGRFDFLVWNWDGEGWLDPHKVLGIALLCVCCPSNLSPGKCYGVGASFCFKIQTLHLPKLTELMAVL